MSSNGKGSPVYTTAGAKMFAEACRRGTEAYIKGSCNSDPLMLGYFTKLLAKVNDASNAFHGKRKVGIIRSRFDKIQKLRKANPDFDKWLKATLDAHRAELAPIDLMDTSDTPPNSGKNMQIWFLQMSDFEICSPGSAAPAPSGATKQEKGITL